MFDVESIPGAILPAGKAACRRPHDKIDWGGQVDWTVVAAAACGRGGHAHRALGVNRESALWAHVTGPQVHLAPAL